MEGVIRGKDLEGQIKAHEVRIEQAHKERDEARHAEGIKDQENHELMAHIGRLRTKQTEQSLVIEELNRDNAQVEAVIRTMVTKAAEFIESFI